VYQTTQFTFDDIRSEDMGVLFCRYKDSSASDLTVSGRELVNEYIQTGKKIHNYLYDIKRNPHKFKVELYHDAYTDDKHREIVRWFFDQTDYKPFIPTDTNRTYYIIAVGEPIFETNGSQGIISFDVETKDAYSYSDWYKEDYNIIANTNITIENLGDEEIYPIISIIPKTTGQTVTITNTTNGGYKLKLTTDSNGNQLQAFEYIDIDTETHEVATDQLGLYRYANMTLDDGFSLVRGTNTLQIDYPCMLTISYQFKYLL
jgi:phage-related protein